MTFRLTETLCRLVAIPSVNPSGRDVSGPEFLETRLTDYLEELFHAMGLRCQRQHVSPGRDNIIARLDGETPPESGGRVLLFDAHQDTQPVDGMTIAPFDPVIRDGRLYGRGSCDTKGSMAAMLAALARLAEERPAGMPTVLMSCPVDEESGFTGIRALTKLFNDDTLSRPTETIFPRKPDAVVVGEPTGLNIVVAHKGAVRWRCCSRGLAAHSSNPAAGENAIYAMARVLPIFERYQAEAVRDVSAHPLCGGATLNVGTIHGGVSVNTVPDRCVVEIDRRVPPGEDTAAAYNHFMAYFAQQGGLDFPVENERPFFELPSLSDDGNREVADRLADAVRGVLGRCERGGVAYGTHAGVYAAAGIPSVVFGPGHIEQAHTDDEWLPLDQLEQAAGIYYYRFALAWAAPL